MRLYASALGTLTMQDHTLSGNGDGGGIKNDGT
jgi:hypothetical protein